MAKNQHHGGAWKIAYADFMTAMMAFFLLLWLLSFSEDQKLTGIANYFKPSDAALTDQGGSGILGGTSTAEDDLLGESIPSSESSSSAEQDLTPPGTDVSEEMKETSADPGQEVPGKMAADAGAGAENPWAKFVEQEAPAASGAVAQKVRQISERLNPFADHVRVSEKDGNIVIDVFDAGNAPMFVSGSAKMTGENMKIAQAIAELLVANGGSVTITGHTDAAPFGDPSEYGNWELSADRANAVRRAIVGLGVESDRIVKVSGVADTEPFDPTDPNAATNRRVSVQISSGA